MSSFTARVVPSIATIDAAAWDACANPQNRPFEETEGERFNPFLTHAFLHALEASGSVGGRSGWAPAHLTVEDAGGRMVAAAPCYLKSHSQGEYVFDHAWADAYERAGGSYYPKLQVAVPFTPVTGRRLLVAAARSLDLGAKSFGWHFCSSDRHGFAGSAPSSHTAITAAISLLFFSFIIT